MNSELQSAGLLLCRAVAYHPRMLLAAKPEAFAACRVKEHVQFALEQSSALDFQEKGVKHRVLIQVPGALLRQLTSESSSVEVVEDTTMDGVGSGDNTAAHNAGECR